MQVEKIAVFSVRQRQAKQKLYTEPREHGCCHRDPRDAVTGKGRRRKGQLNQACRESHYKAKGP